MTGRDLIMYILENDLENEPIFKNGKFIGFLTVDEAASILGVGIASIKVLASVGELESINIDNNIYIYCKSVKDYLSKKCLEN